MIDPVTAIRTLLQGELGLANLTETDTGQGVYRTPPGLPKGVAGSTGAPRAVVLQAVGGDVRSDVPVVESRLYVRCYAPNAVESMAIYRALYGVFYDADGRARGPRRIAGRWLLRSAVLSAPTTDEEPESHWPVTLATLTARFDSLQGV